MNILARVQIGGGSIAAVDFGGNAGVTLVVASGSDREEAFGGRFRGYQALDFVERLGRGCPRCSGR